MNSKKLYLSTSQTIKEEKAKRKGKRPRTRDEERGNRTEQINKLKLIWKKNEESSFLLIEFKFLRYSPLLSIFHCKFFYGLET